jgi:DNA-binding NarL/FixJ family response regulator
LWVGCDEFLDRFDPVTETFTHYRIESKGTPGDPVPVTHIGQDHMGILWLGTRSGLYRFDPSARIIVLTTYTGDVQAVRALRAGARGYVLKGHVHRALLETVRAVHAGQKRIPQEIAAELADHAADDNLTLREIDVLQLIAAGNANKQIADQLSIGEATVKNHVTNILSKLGANDRAHAVTIGLKRGIIELQTHRK